MIFKFNGKERERKNGYIFGGRVLLYIMFSIIDWGWIEEFMKIIFFLRLVIRVYV